jgi:hypothetical protein
MMLIKHIRNKDYICNGVANIKQNESTKTKKNKRNPL